MKRFFKQLRLILFTHSYTGFVIANKLRNTYSSYQNNLRTPEISRLAKALRLKPRDLQPFVLLDKKPKYSLKIITELKQSPENNKILIYLEVEREMINLTLEKQDKNGTAQEDYERMLLEPAIERAAGNDLSQISDDDEFENQLEVLKIKYRTWHYFIACRYKLPTPRIAPFLMRLIS